MYQKDERASDREIVSTLSDHKQNFYLYTIFAILGALQIVCLSSLGIYNGNVFIRNSLSLIALLFPIFDIHRYFIHRLYKTNMRSITPITTQNG